MLDYTKDNIHKLNKTGRSSYSVIIPKDMIRKLGWREKQKLKLNLKGKTISIKDAK